MENVFEMKWFVVGKGVFLNLWLRSKTFTKELQVSISMNLERNLLTARPLFILNLNLFFHTFLRNINLFEQSCPLIFLFNFYFFNFFHRKDRKTLANWRVFLFYISFSSLYRFFHCLPSFTSPFLTLPSLSVLPFHLLASGKYHYLRSLTCYFFLSWYL